jgi:uncharacterized membrane protein YoaK (UPF0700 family)
MNEYQWIFTNELIKNVAFWLTFIGGAYMGGLLLIRAIRGFIFEKPCNCDMCKERGK